MSVSSGLIVSEFNYSVNKINLTEKKRLIKYKLTLNAIIKTALLNPQVGKKVKDIWEAAAYEVRIKGWVSLWMYRICSTLQRRFTNQRLITVNFC